MRLRGKYQIITWFILLPIDIALILSPLLVGALAPLEFGAWVLAAVMLVGLLFGHS